MRPTSGSPASSDAQAASRSVHINPADDCQADSDEDEEQRRRQLQFVVRNTFIDFGDPHNTGVIKREVQSCPNTNLMPAATAFDAPWRPGQAMSPTMPALCGSPQTPADRVPWGADVLEKLVANAAAAVEAKTPTLSKADAVSPEQRWQRTPSSTTPALAEARPMPPAGGAHADPVAAAVAFAAAGADCSAGEHQRSPEPAGLPLEDPRQLGLGFASPDRFAALPNATPGQTWRPFLEDLVESDGEGDMDGAFEGLLDDTDGDMLYRTTSTPYVPPVYNSPDFPQARGSSPAMKHASPQPTNSSPLSLGSEPVKIVSPFVSPLLKAACSPHFQGAMLRTPPAVPASLRAPGPAWQPPQANEPEPEAEGADGCSTPEARERERIIQEFVKWWQLDSRCLNVIRDLPDEELEEVISDFDASAGTKNVNAKFMVWMDSRLRRAEARKHKQLPPPRKASVEALADFLVKWKLDKRSQRYVQSLPAAIQNTLLESFNPPIDTRNLDAKLVAFVKLQMNKESAKCLRLGCGSGSSSSSSGSMRHFSQFLGRRKNLDGERHGPFRWHEEGSGPGGIFDRGVGYWSQDQYREEETLDDAPKYFADMWGLDTSAAALLRSLNQAAQQEVIMNFRASGKLEEVNRRFAHFIKPFLARDMGFHCGGEDSLNSNGRPRRRSDTDGQQPAMWAKPPQDFPVMYNAGNMPPMFNPAMMYPPAMTHPMSVPNVPSDGPAQFDFVAMAQANAAVMAAQQNAAMAAGYMQPVPWPMQYMGPHV